MFSCSLLVTIQHLLAAVACGVDDINDGDQFDTVLGELLVIAYRSIRCSCIVDTKISIGTDIVDIA